jgi:uncharacterized membrane protein YccC
MRHLILLTSAALLAGAFVTFAYAQAPASPSTDKPSVQQEEVAHHKAAMEAEVKAHHEADAVAHHEADAVAHHEADAVAQHKEAAEKNAADQKPAAPNQ